MIVLGKQLIPENVHAGSNHRLINCLGDTVELYALARV